MRCLKVEVVKALIQNLKSPNHISQSPNHKLNLTEVPQNLTNHYLMEDLCDLTIRHKSLNLINQDQSMRLKFHPTLMMVKMTLTSITLINQNLIMNLIRNLRKKQK